MWVRVNHWLRRNFAFLITLTAFIAAAATYFAITGLDESVGNKPKRISNLLLVDAGLLALLGAIIATRAYGLWKHLRAGATGSQLQKRILVLFSLVTITPTVIVSIFSGLFFNLGIQTWFNERVQTAVNESLAVAEAYLDEHKENIRGDAIAMAADLNQVAALSITDPEEFSRIVDTQSALRLLTEAVVLQGNHIIAQGRLSFAVAFEHIPQNVLERAARGEVAIMTTEDDKVRALVKLDAIKDGYLMVGRLIDSKVLNHMEHTQGAVNEYNTLKGHLAKLQMTFSLVFVTMALLLLLSSIWYGMVFASRLTKPVSRLVTAAERVRGGDFSARVADSAQTDELSTLSRAFNRMTEQLEAQRAQLIEANRRIDERRRFSEAVLSGVSAGVIALDRDKQITLFSRSANAILNGVDQAMLPDKTINEIMPGIQELLLQAEHMPGEIAQSTLTLDKDGKTLTLHARVTVERLDSAIEGFIVTFDDISPLVSAQRNAAWADVARRVAHEIRNPLTPIQLAAERLRRKYAKYVGDDQDTFIKYTDTITRHVGDIGRMVEEFVSFARMPTPIFATQDLAAIVKKAVFSAQISHPSIDYSQSIPPGRIDLEADERQLTQVMTNLLKNAAESVESRLAMQPGADKGRIAITLYYNRHPGAGRDPGQSAGVLSPLSNTKSPGMDPGLRRDDEIILTIEDNGIGFPPDKIETLFEPYVTTRSKGTGLGLSIVKKIVEDHKGRIKLENISSHGARVTLSFLQHCDINAATSGNRLST